MLTWWIWYLDMHMKIFIRADSDQKVKYFYFHFRKWQKGYILNYGLTNTSDLIFPEIICATDYRTWTLNWFICINAEMMNLISDMYMKICIRADSDQTCWYSIPNFILRNILCGIKILVLHTYVSLGITKRLLLDTGSIKLIKSRQVEIYSSLNVFFVFLCHDTVKIKEI